MIGTAALARRLRRPARHPGPPSLWYAATATAAACLVILLTKDASDRHDVPLLLAFFGATAAGAALPLSLRRPVTATAVLCVGTATLAWGSPVGADGPWPLTLPGIVVVVAQLGLVAVRHDWRLAVSVWWVVALATMLLVALDPAGRPLEQAGDTLVAYSTCSLLALLAGIAYRQRGRIRQDLAEARRNVELEQGRRALIEERTRIARELHDVVAHSMSVIHMQATSARYRLPDLDETAKAEFTEIAAGARSAMGEMRQLLGALRADGGPAGDRAPAPGFAQLPDLVRTTDRRGTPTNLTVAPDLPTLPETTGTTVYRVVQEALSNAVRHAPGARVTVTVAHQPGTLVVTVLNGPPPAPRTPDHPGPPSTGPVRGDGSAPAGWTAAGSAGHGLLGMRERAELLGGSVTHGPEPAGGFRVTVRLPLPADRRGAR